MMNESHKQWTAIDLVGAERHAQWGRHVIESRLLVPSYTGLPIVCWESLDHMSIRLAIDHLCGTLVKPL